MLLPCPAAFPLPQFAVSGLTGMAKNHEHQKIAIGGEDETKEALLAVQMSQASCRLQPSASMQLGLSFAVFHGTTWVTRSSSFKLR